MKHLALFLLLIPIFQKPFAQQKTQAVLESGSAFINGFAFIKGRDKSYYIDTSGKKAFDQVTGVFHPVDSVHLTGDGYQTITYNKSKTHFIVLSNGKAGLIDNKGQWLLKPIYSSIQLKFKTYLAIKKSDKLTLADTYGKLKLPLQFEDVGILNGDDYDVKQQGKWGIYNASKHKMIIPCTYDAFDYCGGCSMQSDYVYAKKEGKWGVIDFSNAVLIPFKFDHGHYNMRSDNWLTAFSIHKKRIVINIRTGKAYSPSIYTDMELVGNSLLILKKDHKAGLMNNHDQLLVDFKYDNIKDPYDNFSSGSYLIVEQNKKEGVIDEKGKIIVPPVYQSVRVAGHYFIIHQNGRSGLLDRAGQQVLAPTYTEISRFSRSATPDLFKIKQKALYGFINAGTGMLMKPAFLHLTTKTNDNGKETFIEGSSNGQRFLFNSKGKKVLPKHYHSVTFINEQLAAVKSHDLTGIYDLHSVTELIPPNYNDIEVCKADSSLLKATTVDKNGDQLVSLFTISGEPVLSEKYNRITVLNSTDILLEKEADAMQPAYYLFNNETKKIKRLPFDAVESTEAKHILLVDANGKSQLYNTVTGKLLSAVKYDELKKMKNGYYQVFTKQNDQGVKYGYLSPRGKLIVPVIYDYDLNNYDVQYDQKSFLPLLKRKNEEFNTHKSLIGAAAFTGKVIFAPEYDKIFQNADKTAFLVMKNKKFGILSAEGKEITGCQFDDIGLSQTLNRYSNSARFTFPVLCKKGDTFKYYKRDGSTLAVSIKNLGINPLADINIPQ